MDETKKTKKGAFKKETKEEEATAGDLVFGAASNTDIVNFGGEDETFAFKKHEGNVIRKWHYF